MQADSVAVFCEIPLQQTT